jgi:glycosyltransferase involved in cell wall biosynthesis
MHKRLISVIVPTRDRPDTLRQALASIRAHEADDLTFEILVGDNGADPETKKVASDFAAIHIPVAQKGAAAARNAGLAAATGEFIAFLDDDDVWLPTHVREHLRIFDEQPEIEAVLAQVIAVDNDLRELDEPWPVRAPTEPDALVKAMLSGYYPQIGATIVRAPVRDAVGPMDLSLLGDQDWDWQLRLARRRRTTYLKLPCVLFRQRPPGSYDALRFRRLGYARKVFLRHAVREWRVFGSPKAILHSYRDVVWQYFEYFRDAAVARAAAGAERAEIWRAVWGAFRALPLRTAYNLVGPRPLRKAFFSALWPRPPAAPAASL